MRVTCAVIVGANIDVLGFQLGIQMDLTGIQAVVAREHVADTASQCIVQQTTVTVQLYRKENGCNRL